MRSRFTLPRLTRWRKLLLLGCAAIVGAQLAAPAAAQGLVPSGLTRYIVTFKPGTLGVRQIAQTIANGAGVRPDFIYEHAVQGLALSLPTATSNYFVEAIRRTPWVEAIEPDSVVTHYQQQSSPTWPLDRIDQRALPLNALYSYSATGAGVRIYIVDSGVRSTHAEFTGRILSGYTSVSDGRGTEDCHGHGTHVAGIAAGSTYGVAKGASIVPVRVLNCNGSGSNSSVIAGLDWVAANAVKPAVVNMSLGGSASTAVDNAVAKVVAAGVVVAVAAGNSKADACNSSPARAASALTVAATTSSDTRASYSNWGKCVDLFAPGDSVLSAGIASDSATATLSGTSMASPHVAGASALLLEGTTNSPATIEQLLESRATPRRVLSAGTNTPNLLLYTGLDSAPGGVVSVGRLSAAKSPSGSTWTATVTILVRDASNNPVYGADVAGRFSVTTSSYTCRTGDDGTCSVNISLKKSVASTSFSVKSIGGALLTYDSRQNVASTVSITQ